MNNISVDSMMEKENFKFWLNGKCLVIKYD